MENSRFVSVVIPVYNVEKYLRRCIDSILKQDYDAFEVILVDDGSQDNSGSICDEYARVHKNITVIHKENGGLSSARKAGFLSARGDLICFVDSDDYVAKSYLRELSEPFADASVDLSICSYANDKEGSVTTAFLPYDCNLISNSRIAEDYILSFIGSVQETGFKNNPGFVWIRMYRRELLSESDFMSEREYFTEDILMNILYAKRIKGDIAVINKPLYYYCVNPGSLTLKYREHAFDMLFACYKKCDELTQDLTVEETHRQKRLDANLVSAVTYGVYNVGKIRNYARFKKEIKNIFDTHEVDDLFKSGAWPTKASWHKIILYSHRFGLYFFLYKLLKTRKVL